MATFKCNINGEIFFKNGRNAKSLRNRIRQTLKKQYGFWDDSKIDIKRVEDPVRLRSNELCRDKGNSITNNLRHL